MSQSQLGRPVWVDLGTSDPTAGRAFYAALFGWVAEPDEAFGGYAVARLDGRDVAGIGPTQSAEQPSAWAVYVGTSDADELAARVAAAGGSIAAPPFAVGPMGRMAVFQDTVGAFVSAWEPDQMSGFSASGNGTFAWAQLNARGLDRALAFYGSVFGWGAQPSGQADGYTVLTEGGEGIAAAMEMPEMLPAEMPSYWLVYFQADDIDATVEAAVALGGRVVVAPIRSSTGSFAVLSDPQGAAFGLQGR